ncbi:MAG: polyketide synthase dehydratase domain-containing protein, partial [Streptosporangiaceae bacterium]
TVLVEWALRAADEAGCAGLGMLTFETPLVLPPANAVQVQLVVSAQAGERRDVGVYSRPHPDAGWTCHATGFLSVGTTGSQDLTGPWPPPEAERVEVSDFYEQADTAGYGYGPAFRGLTAAWLHGSTVYAEVALPALAGPSDGFGIHPALLDATLHPALLRDEKPVQLPSVWTGVSLWAAGATSLRLRLSTDDHGHRLVVTDPLGVPVLTAEAVVTRDADTVEYVRPAPASAPAPRQRRDAADWSGRLAALPPAEQHDALLDLVLSHAAAVLGHADPDGVETERGFGEIGFDSLTAVELRNRLATATGLQLAATLIFDHPNPLALTRHLHAALSPQSTDPAASVFDRLEELEAALPTAAQEAPLRAELRKRLQAAVARLDGPAEAVPTPLAVPATLEAATLEAATLGEIFDFIDQELGRRGGTGAPMGAHLD